MAMFPVKRRWTSQPPAGTLIDRTHPLARKLLFAFNGADSARPIDSVTGEPATGGTPVRVIKNGMVGLESNGSVSPAVWNGTGSEAYKSALRYLDEQAYSLFTLASRSSDTGLNQNIVSITHNNNNSNLYVHNLNELARQGYNFAGQWNNSVHVFTDLTDDSVHSNCFTFKGGGNSTVFEDGVQTAQQAPGSNTWNAVSTWNGLGLLGSYNDADVNTEATLYAFLLFGEELTPAEAASLDENPWQLWEPAASFYSLAAEVPSWFFPTQHEQIEYGFNCRSAIYARQRRNDRSSFFWYQRANALEWCRNFPC